MSKEQLSAGGAVPGSRSFVVDVGEGDVCTRVQRIIKCLSRENNRIADMSKGSIRINFAGDSLSIRVVEFLVEE